MSEYETPEIDPGTQGTTTMIGFSVEALDGSAGEVVGAPVDERADYLVIDIGKWIFGKQVVVPTSLIKAVDLDSHAVYVNRTKAELKDSPLYGEMPAPMSADDTDGLQELYGPGGAGFRSD